MSEEQPYYPPIPDPGYRFADESGYGFTIGLVGSSILSLFGGLRRGCLAGAARAVSASAPRAAVSLAAYFALYSASEAAMSLARPNKEDLWNALPAGAVSWAALGLRRGAAGAALVAAGVADALSDGRIPRRHQPAQAQQPLLPAAPTTPAAPGFLGIPQGPPIVVQEVSVGDQRM